MRATVTDVAALAGVSISTVSRVLKNNYPVSEDARARVLKAVEELNYTPHYIASSLKSKRKYMLGVIVAKMTNRVNMRISESIAEEALKSGYKTLFAFSENNAETELAILNLFRSSLVDAVIVATTMNTTEEYEKLVSSNIPVVFFDRQVGNTIDYVGDDIRGNCQKVTDYLIAKGHKRIVLTVGANILKNTEDLIGGYSDAYKNAGLKVNSDLILVSGFSEKQACDAIDNYLAKTPKEKRATAIIATSGPRTMGVLDSLYEHGLNVPKDISVFSYGDLGLPRHMRPTLTYISQDAIATGIEIARTAIKRVDEIHSGAESGPVITKIIPNIFNEGDSVRDLNKE